MLMKICKTLKRKGNQKGFTLVELLIVMAILAILAAIAVPRFGASLANAKNQANEANIMMIEKAAQLAVLNGDVTPGSVDNTDDVMSALTEKGYLDKAPVNPANNFTYKVYVEKRAETGSIAEQFEIIVDDGSGGEGGGDG